MKFGCVFGWSESVSVIKVRQMNRWIHPEKGFICFLLYRKVFLPAYLCSCINVLYRHVTNVTITQNLISPLSFHLYSSLPNLQLFAPLFRYPSSHWHSYEPCMLTHFWPVPLHSWFPCLHSSTSEAKYSVSRFALLRSKDYELNGFQETNFKLFNLVFKWMEK